MPFENIPTLFARLKQKKGFCTYLGASGRGGQSLGSEGGDHSLRALGSD